MQRATNIKVVQARLQRQELEDQIMKLVAQFEHDTGLRAEGMSLVRGREHDLSTPELLREEWIRVRVDVRI